MEAPEVPVHLRSWMCAVGEIARAANAGEPVDALLGRVAAAGLRPDRLRLLRRPARRRGAGAAADGRLVGLTADYVALDQRRAARRVVHPSGPALDTPAARAYREHRTVAVADVLEDDRHGRLRLLAEAQAYRALLAVPLRAVGRQLGVLVGYSVAPRVFSPAEQELAELLADQAALALENRRLRSCRAVRDRRAVPGERGAAPRPRGAGMGRAAAPRPHGARARRGRPLRPRRGAGPDPPGVGDGGGRRRRRTGAGAGAGLPPAAERCGPSTTPRAGGAGGPARAATPSSGCPRAAAVAPARRRSATRRPSSRGPGWRPSCSAASWPAGCGWSTRGRARRRWSAGSSSGSRSWWDWSCSPGGTWWTPRPRPRATSSARCSAPTGRSSAAAVERAAALGLDLSRPHALAVVAVDPPQPPGRWHDLVRAAAERETPSLVGPYEDLEVVLVPAAPDPGTEAAADARAPPAGGGAGGDGDPRRRTGRDGAGGARHGLPDRCRGRAAPAVGTAGRIRRRPGARPRLAAPRGAARRRRCAGSPGGCSIRSPTTTPAAAVTC